MKSQEKIVVDTHLGNKNGQDKCPKCGATDISFDIKTGKLKCEFCRHVFDPVYVNGFTDEISSLEGNVVSSGASDIESDSQDLFTLKCSSCGAEVVVNTASTLRSKCHWCRNVLSINERVSNGAVPDVILPFKLEKNDARGFIEKFVKKRSFYANDTFKSEFSTENILGVYLPYVVVDVNAHVDLSGYGEHLVRSYYHGHKEHQEKFYDADLYKVLRKYDLSIFGLTLESSADKANNSCSNKTNNVINAIMPFDIENCVKFNANYLSDFTSEKRDLNLDDVKPLALRQIKDVARFSVNDTLKYYDRGVKWDNEDIDLVGEQWKTAYLPVWIYSYMEKKSSGNVLHYVVVNARTNETMGSVPVNTTKLFLISSLVELFGLFMMLFVDFEYEFIFLALGFIYYFVIYRSYRNDDQRHFHEKETKTEVSNLVKKDKLVEHRRKLRNHKMHGANNNKVTGSTNEKKFF